jgi:hypothetical protein
MPLPQMILSRKHLPAGPEIDLRACLFAILHDQFFSGIRRASGEGTKIELATAKRS